MSGANRQSFAGAVLLILAFVSAPCRGQVWGWLDGPNSEVHGIFPAIRGTSSGVEMPGSRAGHCSAFDPVNREYWLFGGFGYPQTGGKGMNPDIRGCFLRRRALRDTFRVVAFWLPLPPRGLASLIFPSAPSISEFPLA